MEKHEIKKIISGIALIFFTVTEIFTVLVLTLPLIFSGTIGVSLSSFASSVWPHLVVIVTITILWIYTRKQNWSISILLNDRNVRLAAGMLLVLHGIFDLFNHIPTLFVFINECLQPRMSPKNSLTLNVITQLTAIIFVLCKIALGILLLKVDKIKSFKTQGVSYGEEEIKISTGVALFFILASDGRILLYRILARFSQENNDVFTKFAIFDLPWVIATVIIIVILFIFAKKQNWKINDFLQERVIRVTAGTLIVMNGVFELINWLAGIISIVTLPTEALQNPIFDMKHIIVMSGVRAILILCQIVIGICLVRLNKAKHLADIIK